MHPTPQGVTLDFEQCDILKDIHGWFPVIPFHYIAFCPLRYIPKKLMSLLLECVVKGDTPSRNRVHWDDIHYNI
jgi:hypothetical protein